MGVINVPGVRDYATKGATDEIQSGITSVKADTATNNTASKTGTLSQKESYTIGLLENGTYGLNALGKKAYIKCGGDGWRKDKLNAPEGLAPNASTPAKIANVGNYIFIFAAANKCYKYNMVDDSFVLLPTPTQGGFYSTAPSVIGQNIYSFYPNGSYKYNVTTDTYTEIASITVDNNTGPAFAYNNNLYLFFYGTVYRYNTSTNTYTTLCATPFNFTHRDKGVIIGAFIYFTKKYSSHSEYFRYNITKNVFENLGLYFSSTGVPITMSTLGNNFFLSTTEGIYMYNVLSSKETRIAEDSLYFVSETGNTVTVNNCIYSITNYGLIKNSPIKNFPSMYLKQGNQFYTDADVYNSSYTLISGNTIPADGVYYFVGPDPYISIY